VRNSNLLRVTCGLRNFRPGGKGICGLGKICDRPHNQQSPMRVSRKSAKFRTHSSGLNASRTKRRTLKYPPNELLRSAQNRMTLRDALGECTTNPLLPLRTRRKLDMSTPGSTPQLEIGQSTRFAVLASIFFGGEEPDQPATRCPCPSRKTDILASSPHRSVPFSRYLVYGLMRRPWHFYPIFIRAFADRLIRIRAKTRVSKRI